VATFQRLTAFFETMEDTQTISKEALTGCVVIQQFGLWLRKDRCNCRWMAKNYTRGIELTLHRSAMSILGENILMDHDKEASLVEMEIYYIQTASTHKPHAVSPYHGARKATSRQKVTKKMLVVDKDPFQVRDSTHGIIWPR
jgi:hypothetical protein